MEAIYQNLLQASLEVIQAKQAPTIRDLEAVWSRYKYLVLEYSPRHYQAIRQVLKDKTAYPDQALFDYLAQALAQPLDPATQVNAYDHVWGHFKKLATDQEKAHYLDLRQAFLAQQIDRQTIKSYLNQLSKTYQDKYMSHSYFFYGVDKSIPL